MVQMKNTLVKYLDFEVEDPIMTTQVQMIDAEADLSVCTPESAFESTQTPQNQEYLNLLIFHDDSSYMSFMVKTLRKKGVKIVDFP